MNKHEQSKELMNLLAQAARNRPPSALLDVNWENQVMAGVHQVENQPEKTPTEKTVRTGLLDRLLPAACVAGCLAMTIAVVAAYTVPSIDAHIFKASLDSSYTISTSLIHIL